MILDRLENSGRYSAVHRGFAAAFGFLRQKDLGMLPPGRHEVDGDRLYAIVVKDHGRGRQEAKLEAHRNYIDIQYAYAGEDLIGWRAVTSCAMVAQAFDDEKDAELYADEPHAWIATPPGTFAVFFPVSSITMTVRPTG